MTSAATARPGPAPAPASAGGTRGDPHETGAAGRVVVGVHGSAGSLAALEWAARFAASRGYELDLVTAWPEPEEVFVHDVPGHHSEPRSRAASHLDEAVARARDLDLPPPRVGARLVNAPAAAALLEACEEGAVLVVGASHPDEQERPGFHGVDEQCALRAPGAVVVVELSGGTEDQTDTTTTREDEIMDARVAHWTVEVHLSEVDGRTHADARLVSGTTRPLHAAGTARFNPHDRMDVPEVGYEVAAARALRNLADLLDETAQRDVAALKFG